MKALVLAEDYPNNNGGIALMYIHTRNLYHKERGASLTVLNFRAEKDYVIDGIPVITSATFEKEPCDYDILVLHAPNIKHHYRFLKQYGDRFWKMVFFFHGHEVRRINKAYPEPYPYVRKGIVSRAVQDAYDDVKLSVWRGYLPKVAYKSTFVFVSNSMKDEFFYWTGINEKKFPGKCMVIYNCVGKTFEENAYDDSCIKKYDFITVRGNLDGSNYSIDIVNRLAKNTPDMKFLVIGKGEYFSHYEKAPNIEWRNENLAHEKIAKALNEARFALMPTRTDSQGLMACEMTAFGIPLITSDIPVCHEIFGGNSNVYFIDNKDQAAGLDEFKGRVGRCLKDTRYFENRTVKQEYDNCFNCTDN